MAANPGTAVICGALSIIGTAYANHLAHGGYDLLLIDQHRVKLNRLAEAVSTRSRRAVEVVVINGRSGVDLGAVIAQIEGDASIAVVVNVVNSQGCTLLSAEQTQALINGDRRAISRAAVRKFLSQRGVASSYHADVYITAAGNISGLPRLI